MLLLSAGLLLAAFAVAGLAAVWLAARLLWVSGPPGAGRAAVTDLAGKGSGD